MKNIYLFLVLFAVITVSAQNSQNELNNIAESEMKSASKTINIVTNPNTQNYDITYHKLEFSVDPSAYFISGVVTTTYTALSDMTTLTFDLAQELLVSSVKKNNVNLTFTQNTNNELVITLPTTQTTGTSGTVVITYSGIPPQNGFNAFSTEVRSNGSNTLYTLSEPFGARDWWPCKQDLNDKVDSIDVYITAPSEYVAVSNGVETTLPVINGVNKTTHFHHGYPIPAYLICMAVTDYSIYNQTAGVAPNTFPIVNYIYPEDLASVQTQLAQTPLILNLYNNLFEIYPFHNEKYGHAEFGWGGGMEHTTVSFMVGFGRQLIAHEMAHQWFGDKITCGSWKDIWLNEGFATYVASMVIENFDGQAAFINDKSNMINNITAQSNGAVYLTDSEAESVNRIFSSRLSYNKGAMVLNMLRLKMGDALFFQGIKNYLADANLAYKYAVTSDLQNHLEAVYGSSLTEFFNDWVYNQGYPTYTITAQNWTSGRVKFVVNQTQSDPSVSFFEMPIPVRVTGVGGQQADLILNNTSNGQTFIMNVPFVVTGVTFDPKKDIISKNNNITLGLENFELEAINIYSNTTNTKLFLDVPNGVTIEKAVIFNTLGQKLIETATATSWDISNLSTGVHFITITTDFGIKKLKFIKN
jgi:aminopeptidase N